jgi:hypothetical protein
MEDRDEREREGERQRSAPRKEKKEYVLEEEAACLRLVNPAAACHPRGACRRTPSSWIPSPDLASFAVSEGAAGGRGDARHQI